MRLKYPKYTPLAILFIVVATPVFAQEEMEVDEVDEGVAAETEVDPLEAARALGGDVLVMKSGAIMGGVQILRSTPLTYEIELIEGMDPIIIPRRQVEMVEYDDIDPLRDRRLRDSRPKPDDELVVGGKELNPEFEKKLKKPVPGAPLDFAKVDYVQVFAQLAQKTNVVIVIDPSLKKLPGAARLWTIRITPEMTLLEILQKQWALKFQAGKVTYERDKVVLKAKGAEGETEPGQAKPTVAETPKAPVIKIKLGN